MELKDLLPENYRPSKRALRTVALLKEAYQEGREEGREEALREALRRQVESRLGLVPDEIARRIEACHDTDTLFDWLAGLGRARDGAAVKAVFEPEG